MLISCPECNNKISETVNNCPKCGYQITPEKIAEIIKKQEAADKFGCILVVIVIVIVIVIVVIAGIIHNMKPTGTQEGVPAGRYSWGEYLTKAECDEWGMKGAGYGSSDRLSGVYDGSGKKRMATSYISINDKRLAEIWTCFETGYDTAYYKRY